MRKVKNKLKKIIYRCVTSKETIVTMVNLTEILLKFDVKIEINRSI